MFPNVRSRNVNLTGMEARKLGDPSIKGHSMTSLLVNQVFISFLPGCVSFHAHLFTPRTPYLSLSLHQGRVNFTVKDLVI